MSETATQQQEPQSVAAAVEDQPQRGEAAQVSPWRPAEDPGGAELVIRSDQTFWTHRQLSVLLNTLGLRGASNAELSMFLHVCSRTGLDPFLRQIYLIKRREWDPTMGERGGWREKWTIQVGIDGFRIVRERAERRDGWAAEFEDTIWYDAEEREHKVWTLPTPPTACKVVLWKVYRDGRRVRYPAVLRYDSYVAIHPQRKEPMGQWKTQPEHMIEKCCEAFASRRAAPQDLGGLFITEEMQGAGVPDGYLASGTDPAPVTVTAAVEGNGSPPVDAQDSPAAEPERAAKPPASRALAEAQQKLKTAFADAGLSGDEEGRVWQRARLAHILACPDSDHLPGNQALSIPELKTATAALTRITRQAKREGKDPAAVILAALGPAEPEAGGGEPG